MSYRILLVEDEESLQDVIRLNLELEGYHLTVVGSGMAALQKFKAGRFDLVILDVMLPGMDGFAVCQTIRLENSRVPILFLSAKNASQDRVQGLKSGGDDYLVKPFDLEELLLRVQILIKRGAEASGETHSFDQYQFGGNEVDFSTFTIRGREGLEKQLSKREIMLLKLMIEKDQEVVSRKEILETVWGYDVYPNTRTIDNYILAFRKYFEENPKEPRYFHSIRGVGYKFTS